MIDSVSVVMAVYNGEAYLKAQIESVLSELEPGDELIVVDDASTDGSPGILRSFASPRMLVHRNPVNRGVRLTFERGLSLARREIVFLCDQDDVWLPGKRAAFLAAFEREPGVTAVISDAEIMDSEGVTLAPSYMATRGGFQGGVLASLWRSRFIGCAMAVRRSVLESALPIPGLAPMHDMWLGSVASLLGRVVYVPTPYVRYRRHDRNVSPSSARAWHRMLRWRLGLASQLALRFWSLRAGVGRSRGGR